MTTGSGAIIGGTTPAERNVIGPGGIQLSTASTSTVQGNYIGLDKTGTAQLSTVPGLGIGVSAGSDNLIGGSTAGAGNVIGGWAGNGIQLDGIGNNNRVQGNLIGTNATGTAKLPGGQHGIAYFGSGTGNKIGGTAAGEGNLIAAASIEGIILNGTSTDLVVQGNLIGTDSGGDMPFGNFDGILAQTGKGMIGGTAAGAGNRIAFNGSLGVAINTGQPGWAILGNQIYENGSLGISLSGGGVPTGNDDGDADTGANNLQNYPVITTATIAAGMASISGTLNSSAGTAFRLEFFASSSCDPSTNGEGETFIGFANVSTVGNVATFGPLDFALPAGQTAITATATDPNNNTSEFSVCKATNGIFSDSFETPAT
jgi:hypothetical protein